jgi:hypothetical protein
VLAIGWRGEWVSMGGVRRVIGGGRERGRCITGRTWKTTRSNPRDPLTGGISIFASFFRGLECPPYWPTLDISLWLFGGSLECCSG